jgi:predicted RecA/RadA family phage recombinase
MPQAVFVQQGDSIDYTPGANVAAGDVVVQVDLVGVAKLDILANKLGALTVSGVFDFAKATGASTAIPAGTKVYWDDTNNVATADGTGNKLLGKSIKGAGDNDATVRARMSQ